MSSLRVCLAYNLKRGKPLPDQKKQSDLEFDSPQVVEAIKKTIEDLDYQVLMLEANEEAFEKLKDNKAKIDIVFNIAEGLYGDARESQVPLFCEILKIPYTHSSPTTHAISLDKTFTKLLLRGVGILSPQSQVVHSPKDKISGLSFPLIVKPNKEGSSKGILDKNVVRSKEALKECIKRVAKNFKNEVLVEEYIEGKEFTVGLLGNGKPRVLPIIEQKFDFMPKGFNGIASFELKWIYEDSLKDLSKAYECPAKIPASLQDRIVETSIKIYKTLGVHDCARIDYRVDRKGNLYFIEINTLPGLNPDPNIISYFPLAAREAGLSYDDLLGEILKLACERYALN
ncbi:MAG: ATP-grasp domain-containing protein [Candidatus Blackburnbacteria bacterium]|nr:ATP-grasp domain-containing protein [Candidatus Blackburnbacteria bacterium]